MQNVDMRNKSYKQFLVKTKSGVAKNIYIFDFFSIKFFCLLLQVSKHSMS